MPLANEFQEKQNKQAEEIRSKVLPKQSGPREHPEDILIVRNILTDDNTEVSEAIPYANAKKDDVRSDPFNFSQPDTHIYEHSWNTKDFFEVRWDGRPHRIKPGETRFLPRYLADHFAKNLIDFILSQREQKEKLQGLAKNRAERARLYKQIIEGVTSYYNGDSFSDAPSELNRQESSPASDSNAYDIGEVPHPAIGYGTSDEPPVKIEEPKDQGPSEVKKRYSSTEEMIADKTIGELRSEAKQLGIEAKPNWSKEQLAAAIVNF